MSVALCGCEGLRGHGEGVAQRIRRDVKFGAPGLGGRAGWIGTGSSEGHCRKSSRASRPSLTQSDTVGGGRWPWPCPGRTAGERGGAVLVDAGRCRWPFHDRLIVATTCACSALCGMELQRCLLETLRASHLTLSDDFNLGGDRTHQHQRASSHCGPPGTVDGGRHRSGRAELRAWRPERRGGRPALATRRSRA